MNKVSKEEFIINRLAGEIARLKVELAEKEFMLLALDEKLKDKEDEDNG